MFIGVVGKPSVGKSTFFKAATLAEVDIANYPFTTIKPNHAVGFVKIKDAAVDFGKVSNPREGYAANGFRFVPVDMMDVAGLVPGAHLGLGMGNQFLDDLRPADALIHVIDVSGSVNEKGESVAVGSYDPINDIKFLEDELDFWYLEIIKKGWDKFSRTMMAEKGSIRAAIAKQLSGLKVTEIQVETSLRELKLEDKKLIEWTDDELMGLARSLRKKTKPMVIAANKCDMPTAENNLRRIREQFKDYMIIPSSAESELALREAAKHNLIDYIPGEKDFRILDEGKLSDKQKNALNFIRTNILQKYGGTGVQEIINHSIFDILKYIAIFPGGVNKLEDSKGNCLPDCFLMPPGTTALDFAYRLHTDFGDNFIKAIDVRSKMPVGKDHKLKNLDILEIMAKK